MQPETVSDAKRRLLECLKRKGPTTASVLAGLLELTDVAARQHLLALEGMGLVRQEKLPADGRGRPSMLWSLDDRAGGVFPDGHGELTVTLLEAVREAFGEEGIARVVDIWAGDQVNDLRRTMPAPSNSLKSRVEALARQRAAEGYMAEVAEEGPGRFLLIEHHCPISQAARSCAGICSAELEVFQRVLGDHVSVERTSHLLGGGDRCIYSIQSKEEDDDWRCF
ncbi:MAG: transcriptional regulator [Phycisphaerae bacterium]